MDGPGSYAFFMETPAAMYNSMKRPCDTMVMGEPIQSFGYAM